MKCGKPGGFAAAGPVKRGLGGSARGGERFSVSRTGARSVYESALCGAAEAGNEGVSE
jgi:hypothetical protein